jgi:hypothetical protein
MSLDVYLEKDPVKRVCVCAQCEHHHSTNYCEEVYSANITHNMSRMATEARICDALWRPEEVGITKAAQLIEPLRAGLADLKARPDYFQKFNPPNGWGDYAGLVRFVENYLAAAEANPTTNVKAWR